MSKRKYRRGVGQSEDQLQRAVVRYIRALPLPNLMVFHVPNGGSRHIVEAKRFKGLGVVAGVADLVLLWATGEVGFIELKIESGSQSNAQASFEAFCRDAGHRYEVARSLDDVRDILSRWNLLPLRRGAA